MTSIIAVANTSVPIFANVEPIWNIDEARPIKSLSPPFAFADIFSPFLSLSPNVSLNAPIAIFILPAAALASYFSQGINVSLIISIIAVASTSVPILKNVEPICKKDEPSAIKSEPKPFKLDIIPCPFLSSRPNASCNAPIPVLIFFADFLPSKLSQDSRPFFNIPSVAPARSKEPIMKNVLPKFSTPIAISINPPFSLCPNDFFSSPLPNSRPNVSLNPPIAALTLFIDLLASNVFQ